MDNFFFLIKKVYQSREDDFVYPSAWRARSEFQDLSLSGPAIS